MLAAGRFKTIIDVYKPEVVTNEFGEAVLTYVKYYLTRAFKLNISGDTEISNDNIVSFLSISLSIRDYHDVENNFLIYIKNKKYSIDYIDDDEDNRVKVLKCSRILE